MHQAILDWKPKTDQLGKNWEGLNSAVKERDWQMMINYILTKD